MRPEDVPTGDRILPTDTCEKCSAVLEIVNCADDEDETMFVCCPNKKEEKDQHTEHSGVPKATLVAWGWKL